MNKAKEAFKEIWEYSWKKNKNIPDGTEIVQTRKELLSPEFYKARDLVFVWDEKQAYKATHKKRLIYMGRKKIADKSGQKISK